MRAAGDLGYVKSVDALRLKAVDASGEKLLYEDKPLRLIAAFAGSADWQKAKPITSYLLVLATGGEDQHQWEFCRFRQRPSPQS